MKVFTKVACAALCFTLAACGRSAQNEEFPVVEAPNYDASIGPNGAAGVTSAARFTLEAARAAAPGYIVAAGQGQIEGEAYPTITLSAGDEVVFTLLPDAERTTVHAIETTSTQARGPHGEVIGRARFADAPAAEVLFCITEWEMIREEGFACSSASDGNFWRTYRLPANYQGRRDPFTAIDPNAAMAATLVSMRWVAPR